MLSRGIENAQKRIESKNFDARKSLLEYDDVSNDQRQAIYSLRNQLLEEQDTSEPTTMEWSCSNRRWTCVGQATLS